MKFTNSQNKMKKKINKIFKDDYFSILRISEITDNHIQDELSEYHKFVFITEGEGVVYIDSTKHIIQNSDIYIIDPKQNYKFESIITPKGYIMLCKKTYINLEESSILYSIQNASRYNRLSIKTGQFCTAILESIYTEFNEGDEFSPEMIQGYLSILFGNLLRSSNNNKKTGANRKNIYSIFESLLVTHCPELHKVQDYAELLNTTPQNLNAICRKHSNKSASEIITGRIIVEAKRHLIYTDENIEDVSKILNFSEPSTFTKVFKKNVGINPYKYRKENKIKKVS